MQKSRKLIYELSDSENPFRPSIEDIVSAINVNKTTNEKIKAFINIINNDPQLLFIKNDKDVAFEFLDKKLSEYSLSKGDFFSIRDKYTEMLQADTIQNIGKIDFRNPRSAIVAGHVYWEAVRTLENLDARVSRAVLLEYDIPNFVNGINKEVSISQIINGIIYISYYSDEELNKKTRTEILSKIRETKLGSLISDYLNFDISNQLNSDSLFDTISIFSLIKDVNNFKIDIFTQKLSYVISHINNNSNEDNNKNFKKLTNNLKSNFGLVSDIIKYLGINLDNILSERIFLKEDKSFGSCPFAKELFFTFAVPMYTVIKNIKEYNELNSFGINSIATSLLYLTKQINSKSELTQYSGELDTAISQNEFFSLDLFQRVYNKENYRINDNFEDFIKIATSTKIIFGQYELYHVLESAVVDKKLNDEDFIKGHFISKFSNIVKPNFKNKKFISNITMYLNGNDDLARTVLLSLKENNIDIDEFVNSLEGNKKRVMYNYHYINLSLVFSEPYPCLQHICGIISNSVNIEVDINNINNYLNEKNSSNIDHILSKSNFLKQLDNDINDKKISMVSALLMPGVIENSENFISGLTDKIIKNFELRKAIFKNLSEGLYTNLIGLNLFKESNNIFFNIGMIEMELFDDAKNEKETKLVAGKVIFVLNKSKENSDKFNIDDFLDRLKGHGIVKTLMNKKINKSKSKKGEEVSFWDIIKESIGDNQSLSEKLLKIEQFD